MAKEVTPVRATIGPDSILHVLAWVPLDNTYQNTIYFDNKTQQANFFLSKLRQSFDNLTYIRKNGNRIWIEKNAEQLMDCNYIMFQNRNWGSKWFYAFITEVNYVNDITTELVFELDVMQTWFFDFTLEQCFVEREHCASDRYFEWIANEQLETGDYLWGPKKESGNFTPLTCAVMCLCNKDGTAMDFGGGDTEDFSMSNPTGAGAPDFEGGGGGFRGGGAGGSFTREATPATIEERTDDADVGTYIGVYNGSYVGAKIYQFDRKEAYSEFISKVNENGLADEIIASYMVPKPFMDVLKNTGHTKNDSFRISVPVYLGSFGGYVPKNKKLYCYPYNFLVVDGVEDQKIYKYELFNVNTSQTGNIEFREFCTILPNPAAISYPSDYENSNDGNGVQADTVNAVALSHFPINGFKSDTYKAWVAQNSNTTNANLIGGLLGGALSIGGGIAGLAMGAGAVTAPMMIAGGVVSMYNAVAKNVAQKEDMKAMPDKHVGAEASDVVSMVGSRRFRYRNRHITYEYAKRIDDYFSLYGYKINQVKVPNINVRPQWTFCKTVGCNIRGSIPTQDAQKICSIFDAGVTHWKNGNNVGNYSLNNQPVSREQAIALHLDTDGVDYES